MTPACSSLPPRHRRECPRRLNDPDREFAASSLFVQLEVLLKAICNKQQAEESFYRSYFAAVSRWAEPVDNALNVASTYGLSALDGLHVAAALAIDEVVTTEGPTKPIHRAGGIKITTI